MSQKCYQKVTESLRKVNQKVINRSHVNYVLDYPINNEEISLYIRKIDRRFNRINRPFERFSALSEVTEDLLTQNEKYREEYRIRKLN